LHIEEQEEGVITGSSFPSNGLSSYGVATFAVLEPFITIYFILWRTQEFSIPTLTMTFFVCIVFAPLINQALESFKRLWNNHKLLSEGNFMPQQLCVRGMFEQFGSNDGAIRDVFNRDIINETQYGVDLDCPTPENQTNNDIQVRQVTCPVSDVQRTQLEALVQSLQHCPNHGN